MISNERPWPTQQRPYYKQPYYGSQETRPPRPFIPEDTLRTGEVQVERKFFSMTLKENPRGRFLRITEETNGKRNAIIIPVTGLGEFQKLLADMVAAAEALPPKNPLSAPAD